MLFLLVYTFCLSLQLPGTTTIKTMLPFNPSCTEPRNQTNLIHTAGLVPPKKPPHKENLQALKHVPQTVVSMEVEDEEMEVEEVIMVHHEKLKESFIPSSARSPKTPEAEVGVIDEKK